MASNFASVKRELTWVELATLVTTYEPTHVVACWDDDWRPQWRVDLIPSYKAHRVVEVVAGAPDVEEVPDPLEAQIPVIRAELDALGIPIVGEVPGVLQISGLCLVTLGLLATVGLFRRFGLR